MHDSVNHPPSLLVLKNISTGYSVKKPYVVLGENMNASLYRGQLVAVLGPNGAGKSTLMKTILGHIVPLSGHIEWQGVPMANMPIRKIAKCMSAVLTDKIDDRYLTVFDVVSTGRYPYGSFTGKLSSSDLEVIIQAMKDTGMTHFSERRFYTLSDGEKQKTMIARALAQQTPLICLDEPTAFIDSPGKVTILLLLKKLTVEKSITVLMTTHDSELAMQFADELWLVGKNHLFETGTPKRLIERGSVNNLFDQEGVKFNPLTFRFETQIENLNS